jgi:pimeloyl-ACP methyl ester carboxylesterase
MSPVRRASNKGFAVSEDGTRIAWQRHGAGEPVILFIPTWNIVDSRVVRHQVDFLSAQATVVTFDPRGAGASERPDHGYDFTMHAADALAVLDAAGVERASLVTASRGVNSAILLAARYPERVGRLVAIAPYVRLEPKTGGTFWTINEIREEADLFSAHGWRTEWPAFARWFMSRVFSEPDSEQTIREVVEIALEASPEILITQELELNWDAIPPLLKSVTNPTLLMHGDGDVTTPMSMGQALTDALPSGRLEVIPGGGHRPDIRTPERVNRLIAAFLIGSTPEEATA